MLTEFDLTLADEFTDDWYGLYEFDWTLNSLGFEPSPSARLVVLERLIVSGVMELYFSSWDQLREAKPLPTVEALSAISDFANWEPPTSRGAQLYVMTTSSVGEALINRSFQGGRFVGTT